MICYSSVTTFYFCQRKKKHSKKFALDLASPKPMTFSTEEKHLTLQPKGTVKIHKILLNITYPRIYLIVMINSERNSACQFNCDNVI
jgi:hypothetical protein